MPIPRPLAIVGAAALVAGLGVAAYAKAPAVHVLRIALPDGGIELVRYTGDAPPRLLAVADPAEDPFAAFDRIAAMMDEQADALMRQVAALPTDAAATTPDDAVQATGLADAPAGAHDTSISTTTIDGHSCTIRIDRVAQGAGKPPKLLRRVSGDGCAAAAQAPAAPTPPATPPAARPASDTI